MFGKNNKIILFLIICCLVISGCVQNKNNNARETISSFQYIDKKENYFTLKNNKEEFYERQEIEDYYVNKKELLYPLNYEFTIFKLVSNKFLIGEARQITKLNNRFLAIYNIKTQELKNIIKLESIKDNNVEVNVKVSVLYADENNILYKTFYKGINKYYIYDFTSQKEKLFLTRENVPEVSFDQAMVTKDYIVISILNIETQKYELKYYNLDDLIEQTITSNNSGFPTLFNDKLYYLEIDNIEKKTELIEIDFEKNEKNVKYKTITENNYITFLAAEEDKLLIGLREEDITKVYIVDKNSKDALLKYKANWIETPQIANNKLAYLGDKRDEHRLRMQYYLIDFINNKDINNTGGPIYLTKEAVVWLNYKVEDRKIPRGRLFTNDYTSIYYADNNKNK